MKVIFGLMRFSCCSFSVKLQICFVLKYQGSSSLIHYVEPDEDQPSLKPCLHESSNHLGIVVLWCDLLD
jgi:hypothetical protein